MAQKIDNFGEPVPQPFERQIREELAPSQQPSIGIAQYHLVTYRFPVFPDDADMMLHDHQRSPTREKRLVGRAETPRQLTAPFGAVELHPSLDGSLSILHNWHASNVVE